MANKTFRINGRVIDSKTQQGIQGLRVETWDNDLIYDDLVGSASTDENGVFQITFDESYFREIFLDREPDLFFKISREEKLIASTENSTLWNVKTKDIKITIRIKDIDNHENIYFSVNGKITKADDTPISGVEVNAYHLELREEHHLGKTTSDKEGNYKINYRKQERVDLKVTAVKEGKEIASPVIKYNAKKHETIDFVEDGKEWTGPSEYKTLHRKISAFTGDLPIAELTEADIQLLAGKTAADTGRISYLVRAERLAQRINSEPEPFYALFRNNMPRTLPGLAVQDEEILRNIITKSAAKNIISEITNQQIARFLIRLKETAVQDALTPADKPDTVTLGNLFAGIAISKEQQENLLNRFTTHKGPVKQFWESLRKDENVGDELIDDIQFTLQAGLLTEYHLPLVEELQEMRLNDNTLDMGKLTAWDREDWLTLINKKRKIKSQARTETIGVPGTVPGITDQEKAANFARAITRKLELAFPSEKVTSGIKKGQWDGASEDITTFFNHTPGFDFKTAKVEAFIEENRETLEEKVKDKQGLVRDLKGMQRLFRIAPDFDKLKIMGPLKDAGLDSAVKIKRNLSKKAFINKFSSSFAGPAAAGTMYNKVSHVAATTLTLFTGLADKFQGVTPAFVPSITLSGTTAAGDIEIPDLETLFGSLSFCECEHCRSVYSPAAYMVDLLRFLGNADTNDAGETPLDVLMKRRPDLGEIKLSCENTNTAMPYIDLVMEILENAVLILNGQTIEDTYQTEGTTAELQANPEHINAAAYEILEQAVYPFNFPFAFFNEEGRIYLDHIGVERYQLMETFQYSGSATEPADIDVACEHLRLSSNQKDIIIREFEIDGITYTIRDFWGMTGKNWLDELSQVDTFLDKAGITYSELLQLLQVEFLQPDRIVTLDFAGASSSCDIEGAVLTNTHQDFCNRVHRFLRLWKKLGWDIPDMDKIFRALAFQDTDIDETALIRLHHIKLLEDQLKAPLVEMLSWWADIDTHVDENDDEDRSFYEELFLNKAVIYPLEEVFALNEERTRLAIEDDASVSASISDYTSQVAAALEISSSDLSLLTETVDDDLTLASLSALFRKASMARALNVSVREFLKLLNLIGENPFDKNATGDTAAFVEKVQRIQASNFSIKELDYLFRHEYESIDGIAPGEDDIAVVLADIRGGLQKISEENAFTSDPTGDVTRTKLALFLEDDTLAEAIAITEGTSENTTSDQETFIDENLDFLDTASIKDQLLGTGSTGKLETTEERYDYILGLLLDYLTWYQSVNHVSQVLSTTFAIDISLMQQLLTELAESPENPAVMAVDEFLDETFIHYEGEDDALTDDFPALVSTYMLLHKITLLLSGFEVTIDELPWIFENSPALGWITFNTLPLESRESGTDLFTAWEKMSKLFELRDNLPSGDLLLIDILDMANNPANYDPEVTLEIILEQVSELTGWESEDLVFLAGSSAFNLDLDAFKDEEALFKLYESIQLIEKIGTAAEEAWKWTILDLEPEQAENIKLAAKAKYSNENWLSVAKPLRDELRRKQRDALRDYLIAYDNYEDENDLIEHFLIDVEMDPCMLTSRIKQANCSIQMFIQRCLMNLEEEAFPDEDKAKEWEWMKNYRVWEANRKVFLYPENWIEPELREDKSEFFEELENELLQAEVTDEVVERAFMRYLEKVDAVSNIEICGHYHQYEESEAEDDTIDILHIFGRTASYPHEYYYRKRVDSSYWTPWEKVNLDIEGDHLMPVIIDRRLFLFWPVFTEISKNAGQVVEEYDLYDFIHENMGITDVEAYLDELSDPFVRYEIKCAYSEYKVDKWLPKKISKDAIYSDEGTSVLSYINRNYSIDKQFFVFYTDVDTSNLIISSIQTLEFDIEGTGSYSLRYEIGKFTFDNLTRNLEAEDIKPFPWIIFGLPFNIVSIRTPEDTELYYNKFRENSGSNDLELYSKDDNDQYIAHVVLNKTPGIFNIPIPYQYEEFISQTDFFYQDDHRSFLVVPKDVIPGVIGDYLQEDNPLPGIYDPGTGKGIIRDINNFFYSDRQYIKKYTSIINTAGKTARSSQRLKQSSQTSERKITPTTITSITTTIKTISTTRETISPATNVTMLTEKRYTFHSFFHPYVSDYIKAINKDGIDSFMNRDTQLQEEEYFESKYEPEEPVLTPYPLNEVDFSYAGAYSPYNWELFFHIPLLMAVRLSQNQQFEEAQKWFHTIFNPTDRSNYDSPGRYWNLKPFFQETNFDSIYELMVLLSYSGSDSELKAKKEDMENQVAQWRANPFDPHLIAGLRPTAYMKTVVMKYIDNLIAWGDYLFSQDTIETLNEATQLYIIARRILGDRPEEIPARETEILTYNELLETEYGIDAFSNALAVLEDYVVDYAISPPTGWEEATLWLDLYFCIPHNEQLLEYWDTIEDRLFKIRNCMNIEGVVRELALFEPPIEPGLLVKARAAGLSIGDVLSDMNASTPYYRFNVMMGKALEFCSDVKTLGSMLLSALEKKDAEELALLRSGHEVSLLEAVKSLKELQLEEAQESLESLRKSREITESKSTYYREIEKISKGEESYLDNMETGEDFRKKSGDADQTAAILHILPNVSIGFPSGGSVSFGGSNLGAAANAVSTGFRNKSAEYSYKASKDSTNAGYERRWDDWKLQEELAEKELGQIDQQIVAAEVRVSIMEKELENHEKQLENAREVDEFMTGKYTNNQLYNWMISQISTIYFQTYQMAYDLGKRAQKTYQYELGVDNTFIQFGYWDSLKKGLLAGEKLHYDLKRMEASYLEKNKREYEISKHISIAAFDPIALVMLKETGECYVNFPEVLFDLDFPGHYLRRIRSVSLTIPCVTGPYTPVSCTLTLLSNQTRVDSSPQGSDGNYWRDESTDDPRFKDNIGAVQSIATSSARNDSGMFELNFRDERYLPFEGAGVISQWRLELPKTFRQFDYSTISDVIFHLAYTARNGGSTLKESAENAIQETLNTMAMGSENTGLFRSFSARHEFPNQWNRFLYPPDDQETQTLELEMNTDRFPYLFREKEIQINKTGIFIRLEKDFESVNGQDIRLEITHPNGTITFDNFSVWNNVTGLVYAEQEFSASPGSWSVQVVGLPTDLQDEDNASRLNPDAVDDIGIVCFYSVS